MKLSKQQKIASSRHDDIKRKISAKFIQKAKQGLKRADGANWHNAVKATPLGRSGEAKVHSGVPVGSKVVRLGIDLAARLSLSNKKKRTTKKVSKP